MAKSTSKINTPPAAKPVAAKEPINTAAFAFGRENYVLLITSAVVLIIGYMLMSGGQTKDPNVFSDEIFSFRRITLAPFVVIAGYIIGIYAIVKKAD